MTNYRILIVDDSIENLKSMVNIIENHHLNFTIYQTNNAKDAVLIAKLKLPDLIITDWDMPLKNGIELITELKSIEKTKEIPCIVVSGIYMNADHLKTALDAGAIDYIRKPIEAVELLARMNSAINIVEKQNKLIKEKEHKIAENMALESEITHFLHNLKSRLNKIEKLDNCPEILSEKIGEIIDIVAKKSASKGWKRQMKAYEKLHPQFVKDLLNMHPDLSPTEIEICQMTRLGLDNKEISELFFITLGSLRVSKSRLRKKMNLTTSQNLRVYLSSI